MIVLYQNTDIQEFYLVAALQHGHIEARREEALHKQGGCLQLCNCIVGAHP